MIKMSMYLFLFAIAINAGGSLKEENGRQKRD